MKAIRIVVLISILLLLFLSGLYAKDIRIITPYFGSIRNELKVHHINQKLDDSSFLGGLYFQWVKPDKYQWNVFLYKSKDINNSLLLGSHLIFDYYFNANEKGQYVVGIGFDLIKIDTDDISLSGLSDFEMINTIYALYLRAGKYFYFGNKDINYSLMFWGGFESDMVRGNVSFKISPVFPQMPEVPVEKDIDKNYEYGMIGAMLKTTIYHFIELKLKYHGKISLENDDFLSNASFMFNLYFSRSLGISYRLKYMEGTICNNCYHIGGLSYVF